MSSRDEETNESEYREQVRSFVLEEFLPGEDSESLEDETRLITGGILDSISTLRLMAFLEETYGFELAADEANAENLDSVALILALIQSKKKQER